MVGRMSVLASDVAVYDVSDAAFGAKAVEYCESRSHSSAPEASVLAGPTWISLNGTCGSPKWSSNFGRSDFACEVSPAVMMARVCPAPVAAAGAWERLPKSCGPHMW